MNKDFSKTLKMLKAFMDYKLNLQITYYAQLAIK